MLTLVICLVVLGGSIAAVLLMSPGGEDKPATDAARPHRERPTAPATAATAVTTWLRRLVRQGRARLERQRAPSDQEAAPQPAVAGAAGPPSRPSAATGSGSLTTAAPGTRERPRPDPAPALDPTSTSAPAPRSPAPQRVTASSQPRRTAPAGGTRPGSGARSVRVITVSPWQRVRAVLGLVVMTGVVGLLVAGVIALAFLAIALGLREAVG